MQLSRIELEAKAKEINDLVYGQDRKKKPALFDATKQQVDLSAKFALQKAFLIKGISESSKKAFVSLLKDQKDAINLLFVADAKTKEKAIEMLKPIFGYRSSDFFEGFQSAFSQLQSELDFERKRLGAI